uniref:Family with sequence similarity 168 member B n=1 Tax=Lepisosteus oculatus TaxID=7918 RepID=W5MU18_LEPOC
MNPVYSPAPTGVPYPNSKGIGYPAGFPVGYAAAAPAYSPNMYPGASTAFQTASQGYTSSPAGPLRVHETACVLWDSWSSPAKNLALTLSGQYDLTCTWSKKSQNTDFRSQMLEFWYTPGTPYKVSPTTGAVPPYSSSPNPYQAAVYPVRSAYPQQNPYAQQGTYYTQPLYATPPHVIHHTTVVQPNGMPAAMYAPPIPPPRANGVTMGMVAGTTMAMSAGTLLTTHSPTPVAPHPVTMPTYRPPGTPTYSYVPPQW